MFEQFASQYMFPLLVLSVTFALGLSLTIESFRTLAKYPRPISVGLLGQFVLLPVLAVLMGVALPLDPVIVLGLTLVCLCPGGAISNAIVFAINARAALSIALTVCASLIMMVTLPIIMPPLVSFISGEQISGVTTIGLIRTIMVAIALPLTVGMAVRHFAPRWAGKAIRILRPAALILLIFAIVVSFYMARDFLSSKFGNILGAATLLSFLGVYGGYALSRSFGLDIEDRLTIAVETGVQNTPFVVFLGTSVLGRPDLTIIAVTYGTVNFLVIFSLVLILRRARVNAKSLQAGF